MSFFDRFLTRVNFFLIDSRNQTRFSETGSLSDQNCILKNFGILKVTKKNDLLQIVGACAERKFSNLLRFENGFDIRNLHHMVTKKVSHTISQILRVTEIQQIRSNQLMFKNR